MSTSQISIITGYIGKEINSETFPSGKANTRFSLAVTESYTNKEGDKVESTEWFKVSCWGNNATFAAKYLTKGSLIQITGKFKTRSFENKEGGLVYITELIPSIINPLSIKKVDDLEEPKEDIKAPTEEDAEDLPF